VANINYPGNSNADREKKIEEPVKNIEPLEGVQAVQRKKTIGRRIAETFTGDDMSSVGEYLLFDVFIPAAKTTISDLFSQGIERFLFGDGRPTRSTSLRGSGRTSYTSYDRISTSRRTVREDPRSSARDPRATDFGEIVFATRGQAETALERLEDLIKDYDVALVSDLYSMANISSKFTDEKWGWTDLRDASVRPTREGYLLLLPRPKALD
jgi:hypothetical protein